MNIAFWGGCINRQQSITANQHYHAIVKQALVEDTGIKPKTWQRFYSSFYELEKEAIEMLQRDMRYDYFVIFLRPFTLMPLTKLLIRYTNNDLQQKWAISPKYSNARYYEDMIKEYKIPVQSVESGGTMHNTFIKLNDFGGDILGLHAWAHNQVLGILENIHKTARLKGTELILLGPPLYPFNPRLSKSCATLNNKIAAFARVNHITHVDMVTPAKNEWLFSEPDGRHINPAGHAFMAEGIIRCLQVSNTLIKQPEY